MGQKAGTVWDFATSVTAKDINYYIFLLQDILHETDPKINYSLWSILEEWRIYFLFPVLVVCFKKFGSYNTTLLTFLVSSILWLLLENTSLNNGETGISPHYLALFTFSMLAANEAFASRNQKTEFIQNFTMKVICSFTSLIVLVIIVMEHIRIYEVP